VRHVHVLKGEATPDDTHRLVYGSDTSDPRTGLWPLDRPAFLRWLAAERGRIVATVIAKRLDLGLAAVPAVRDDRAEQQARLERARTRSVFIATPIARHPTRQFLNCYIKTTSLLLQLGIRMFVQQVAGSSNLPRARNELVAHFLASDYTDLLFIDDDMAWDANDVLRLLASDKPMIGGVGCKKVERPDTVPEKWCFCAHEPLHQDEMGAIEVEAVGTGFLKIAREVFEQLAQAHPDWKRNGAPSMSDTVRANYYRFFRFPDDDIDDPGEDIEFCREWRRNGGEVWIDPAIRLGHVGEKEYSGDFTALLEPENEIGRIQPRRAGH
ncbi:MAG TPA: hypothetical protein VGR45_00660, partial [Stellaceae bacterium]|nr:hypothetical protein [Stellaceae bacterium]